MTAKEKELWLDRSLLIGGYLALVTSQEEYEAALADLKIEDSAVFIPESYPAVTHMFTNVDGSIACIVGLNMELAAEQEPISVAALLVHEAVHVFQHNEARAGAMGCFGSEGEAYAIQNIATKLMQAYAERISTTTKEKNERTV